MINAEREENLVDVKREGVEVEIVADWCNKGRQGRYRREERVEHSEDEG